jgi:hypothetical protein
MQCVMGREGDPGCPLSQTTPSSPARHGSRRTRAFQALSDDNDIFLFRQSRAGDHADMVDNTLLLDRYEVAGTRLQLKTSDGSPEPTCVLDFVRHLHAGPLHCLTVAHGGCDHQAVADFCL